MNHKHTTILIDMDDVLFDFNKAWVSEINRVYNRNHIKEEFGMYDPHVKLDLPNSIYEMWLEERFFENLDLMPDASRVLPKLWNSYNCYIASAPPFTNDACGQKWRALQKHFPFIVKDKVIFTRDKSMIRGDYLIDDHIRNLEPFLGISVCFDQPWNKDIVRDENIIRVHNWNEIERYFLGESEQYE